MASLTGVIDYNVLCFREAISKVFELRLKNQSKMETSIEMMDGSGSTMDDEQEFGVDSKATLSLLNSLAGGSGVTSGEASHSTGGGSSSVGLIEHSSDATSPVLA